MVKNKIDYEIKSIFLFVLDYVNLFLYYLKEQIIVVLKTLLMVSLNGKALVLLTRANSGL